MAVKEYQYQPTEPEEIEKATKFFQNQLNLRDWQIELEYEKRPSCIVGAGVEGGVYCYPNLDKAVIWLPLRKLAKNNTNVIDVLIHEILHIFTYDKEFPEKLSECISYRLSGLLYEFYCYKNNIEVAKER